VHAISGVPDKVVRIEWLRPALLKLGWAYFGAWRRYYSIPIPIYNLYTAETPEGPVTHVVIDRIYGIALKRGIHLAPICREELDELLFNLLRAMFRAYQQRRPLCGDMGLNQFMYGHRHGERRNTFYLVDVDPWLVHYSPRRKRIYDHCFWLSVYRYFPADVRRAERWLGGTLKLTKTRIKLAELQGFVRKNGIKNIPELT
jgi:hypothetical protein